MPQRIEYIPYAIVCIVFADLFECVTLDCRLAVILVVFWKKQWQRSLKSF